MAYLSAVSLAVAVAAGLTAQLLTALIGLITNVSYYGRLSTRSVSPAGHPLGAFALFVPALGGLVVGLMARYGSERIRGHGIDEAIDQILTNESRIAPRMTILKPLSAAVVIGTGGPFGAEGPIIATGGALGSLVGQFLKITTEERKTLLAAGAAAGLAGTFGTPLGALLLSIELLLFEFRARSLVPVALASAAAAAIRTAFVGPAPVFGHAHFALPTPPVLAFQILLGALLGLVSVGVTRSVHVVERWFQKVPIHWMWWPALGGLAVGLIGLVAPKTLGSGYVFIEEIVTGRPGLTLLFELSALKFLSWAISLGSGTSGGTLAPLFTIGGALGALASLGARRLFPHAGFDPHTAALIGMAGMFAGCSHAFLGSVALTAEGTQDILSLIPLLLGGGAAYLVSTRLMRTSMMTARAASGGAKVATGFGVDFLETVPVREAAAIPPVSLSADETVERVRAWLDSQEKGSHHQGFPVVDAEGRLVGVVTRRDLLDPSVPGSGRVGDLPTRDPIVVYEDSSLREAADLMAEEGVGRLPVVARARPHALVGFLTRSNLLEAHKRRIRRATKTEQTLEIRLPLKLGRKRVS